MTETVKQLAPEIFSIIKASNSILLHCHPSPDPDSVGSALAMKFALESLGKKVTIIGGDSAVPAAFSHFPGFASIIPKNYFEIDLSAFDLFIIQDAGSLGMISRKGPIVDGVPQQVSFPESLKTIVIDHHVSNEKYARNINLVDPVYPATALILFDLFKEWGIELTHDIAVNLFIGLYTDTLGFQIEKTIPECFIAAAELTRVAPDFHKYLFTMNNSLKPGELVAQGVALSHIETFLDGHVAIASVTQDDLMKNNLVPEDASAAVIAGLLKSVIGWDVGACIVQIEPGKFKGSLRTRNSDKYNLSQIATSLGGGGHKAAAGIRVEGTLAEAKKKIVDAIMAVVQ